MISTLSLSGSGTINNNIYDSDCSITTCAQSFWCKSRSNGKLNHDIKLAQTTQGETSNEKTWGGKQNRNQGNKDKTEKTDCFIGSFPL
jgi:hypothetical protein